MPVSDVSPVIEHIGNGVTTVYPYGYKILAATDMTVWLDDVLQTGGYTVSGAGVDSGGDVTFSVAPAASVVVRLQRNVSLARTTDYQAGGAFREEQVDADQDKQTMQIQQVNEAVGRSIKFLPGAPPASAFLPDPESLHLLGWNDSANALINYDPIDFATLAATANWKYKTVIGDGSAMLITLDDNPGVIANLDISVGGITQTPVTDYTVSGKDVQFVGTVPLGAVVLIRYGTALPQGYIDASAVYASDGAAGSIFTTVAGFISKIISSTGAAIVGFVQSGAGAVARSVLDRLLDRVSVFDFMSAAQIADVRARTALVDVTAAVQAAWNSGHRRIHHPSGVYLCGNLTLPGAQRTVLSGDGKDQTVIRAKPGIASTNYLAAQPAYVSNSTSGSNPLVIDGMQFDGAGLVERSVVFYSFFSEFKNSAANGGTIQSLTFTSEGISGAQSATTLVENKVINCLLEASGSAYALRTKDAGAKCTDMQVVDTVFNGDVIFDTMAGVQFIGNHVYAGAATFNRLSRGSVVDANYFENEVNFDDYKADVVSVGTNVYVGRVTCSFGSGGRVILFEGGTWVGSADLYHNYFDPARRIIVNGGSFEAATPVVFGNAGSTGWVSFNSVYNHSLGLFQTGSRQAAINSIRPELPFSPSVSSAFGDQSATLTWGVSNTTNRWGTTLTTDKTVTLSTTNAINGAKFRVVRTAGGAFNLNVTGAALLKALATNTWCEVEYDGAAWILSAYGSL